MTQVEIDPQSLPNPDNNNSEPGRTRRGRKLAYAAGGAIVAVAAAGAALGLGLNHGTATKPGDVPKTPATSAGKTPGTPASSGDIGTISTKMQNVLEGVLSPSAETTAVTGTLPEVSFEDQTGDTGHIQRQIGTIAGYEQSVPTARRIDTFSINGARAVIDSTGENAGDDVGMVDEPDGTQFFIELQSGNESEALTPSALASVYAVGEHMPVQAPVDGE